jgi:hypothetical protein
LTLITIFILYILFQSFVLSRHESEIIVAYGFHVGALFSVFFSLMLGCFLLKSFNSPKASRRGAAAAVAIWIIAVQSHNFEYILEGWRMHSATKTDCQFFPRVHVKYVAPKFILPEGSAYASESGGSERSTRERVFEAWQKWREHPLELPDFGSEPIHCREMWAVEELAHKHKEAVYDLTGVSLFWRWPAD